MSFASPWRLLLVVAPLALLVAYLIMLRKRRKYALRFTSVDLLASVAPRRPGWQRHISSALMLVALLALVVGFARPAHSVRVAKQRGTIMLAIDTSGSMAATDVSPSRLAAAEASARGFVEKLPRTLQVGLISFNSGVSTVVAPTSDHASVLAAIKKLEVGGGTATGEAINQALAAIAAVPRDSHGHKAGAAVVLMSDGSPTIGANGQTPAQTVEQATASAKQAGVPVDSIAFGTSSGTIEVQGETVPVPADPQTMTQIASGSGGKSFTAASAGQLTSVYEQIRRSVGYTTEHRDLTVWFAGIGLFLLMLTAAAALLWTERVF